MKYYGKINDEYDIVHKKFVEETINTKLENVSNIFSVNSIAAMNELTEMVYGDLCIIMSSSIQSLYQYCAYDQSGVELSTPQWLWLTDLGGKNHSTLQTLTGSVVNEDGYIEIDWNVCNGYCAKIDWGEINNIAILTISGVHEGDCGIIDVYNDTSDAFVEAFMFHNTLHYSFPPDWNYLAPNSNQHYRYSFYYDGIKFDWNRSVRENGADNE